MEGMASAPPMPTAASGLATPAKATPSVNGNKSLLEMFQLMLSL